MAAEAPLCRERLQAEERKEQIVQTVLRLVHARGADSVSTQLIADTIGRSQGVVFRHFPTKEALWTEVLAWLQESLEGVWTRALLDHRNDSPVVRLEKILLGHVGLIEKFPAIVKVVMSDDLRHRYPTLNEQFQQLHIRYERHVTDLLAEAIRVGQLPKGTNISDAATLYFCIIQGLGFQSAIAGLRSNKLVNLASKMFSFFVVALENLQAGAKSRKPGSEQKRSQE
ncbi:TetR/AcrR family transcriptional regulator [Bradyrhizobium sp. McL0616]|uniref:TetR/AcrR family transcriptional regulator n=1 Tax=Bradyrhizobium sp. McL0616 TaxID=3415674 RepID=UPI003CEB0EEE